MSRTQTVLLIVLALAAVLAVVLFLRNPEPPMMPRDEDHRAFIDAVTCFECHGPDGVYPQSKDHPISQQCLSCHAFR